MIDGTSYDVKDVAESLQREGIICRYLYDIFVNSSYLLHPCPILIAVNKDDLPGCKENSVVFDEIERELLECFSCLSHRDQIKESRGSVETVGESNVNKLGVEGQVRHT